MLCVISGGTWNNGSNAGVWTLNLNNVRGNSNNNVGFRADSLPRPCAAHAAWKRGIDRRGLRRNPSRRAPLVATPAMLTGQRKLDAQHLHPQA
jgi:hypothetical protein